MIGSAVAQGDIERRRRPAILRFRDQPHVRKLREHPDCVVGRGTVDYNNLVCLAVLREHARNRIGEKSRLFQNEDDHRNGREGRRAEQLSGGVPEIAEQGIHGFWPEETCPREERCMPRR